MATYEQKLNEFVQGKRLLRLPRPIRDRADVFCDACGSSQPRTLYALKDLESDRYYFLGETCLKETTKRGVVLRRYGKESGQHAFNTEMERRSSEGNGNARLLETPGEPSSTVRSPSNPDPGSRGTPLPDPASLAPVVLVSEAPDRYRAVISLVSGLGILEAWGRAEEPRYQESWRLDANKGLLLEQVKEERKDALEMCLARAWHEALGHYRNPSDSSSSHTNSSQDIGVGGLAGPSLAQLQLVAAAMGGSPDSNGARLV
jgi:hypothetical protein